MQWQRTMGRSAAQGGAASKCWRLARAAIESWSEGRWSWRQETHASLSGLACAEGGAGGIRTHAPLVGEGGLANRSANHYGTAPDGGWSGQRRCARLLAPAAQRRSRRRGWDSNPRSLTAYSLSRRAESSTLAPLRARSIIPWPRPSAAIHCARLGTGCARAVPYRQRRSLRAARAAVLWAAAGMLRASVFGLN